MSRLRKLLGRGPGPLEARIPVGMQEVQLSGPEPLASGADPEKESLDIAFVIPSFRQVSGGHTTIAGVVRSLEARGHHCSLWIVDDDAYSGDETVPLAGLFQDYFGAIKGDVHDGFDEWQGADIVVATGWQTTPSALRLPNAKSRAYLVQDHEPEFYATSAERLWATWTYSQGMHCITASNWLADVVRSRYGCTATAFDIAVDHATYPARSGEVRDDLVVFYARAATPRRGVPLGLLALEELHRRRPDVEIAMFGEERSVRVRFPHTQLGVQTRQELAELYASATAGLVLSLTNPSLIPNEMLAVGLPCVDIASESATVGHGKDTPITLAPLTATGICDSIEELLQDKSLRERKTAAGIERVAHLTWERTGEQVEEGLRTALREAAGKA